MTSSQALCREGPSPPQQARAAGNLCRQNKRDLQSQSLEFSDAPGRKAFSPIRTCRLKTFEP
eukprot:3624076-Amphidinium_carterae.1